MKYSFPKILEILLKEERAVLASIVETRDSAPQVPGSAAVFSESGLLAGTVGGGLLEAKAAEVSARCLGDGKARLVTFRLEADIADGEGAICGGEATVLFDPIADMEKRVIGEALRGLRARIKGILLTRIVPSAEDTVVISRTRVPPAGADSFREAASEAAFLDAGDFALLTRSAKPVFKKTGQGLLFAEPLLPLPRLIIAGAGHVGRAVAQLGNLLDFAVTVIDDRPEFANPENVPAADTIIVGDIEKSVRAIPPFSDDYFVIVTRGHRHDAAALRACIGRDAAYVGMIGSKTKVALMKEEFLEKGWATAGQWDRIHAPVGLEIRSRTVEEIAVSIAAELVLVRAGGRAKGGR